MEKKLSDYLHYYLGCKVMYPGMANPKTLTGRWLQSLLEKTVSVKPILRRLEDMTKQEEEELEIIKGARVVYRSHLPIEIKFDTPDTFHWMLKRHFDLFGLVDAGLAIDAATLLK